MNIPQPPLLPTEKLHSPQEYTPSQPQGASVRAQRHLEGTRGARDGIRTLAGLGLETLEGSCGLWIGVATSFLVVLSLERGFLGSSGCVPDVSPSLRPEEEGEGHS
jgi:hypothetical protein